MSTSMPRGWGITSLHVGVCLGAWLGASCPGIVGMTRLGGARRNAPPQRWQNRCCRPLPTDALIDLKVRGQLSRFIPI